MAPWATCAVRDSLGPWGAMTEATAAECPEFLDRLRAGDRAAFEELVRVHQHRVYGLALRMLGDPAEAQDVAQDAFLRAHRGAAAFRGEARVSTWLHAITARLCLTRLAARRRGPAPHEDGCLAGVADDGLPPDRALEREELQAALRRAIADLPAERRVVVLLRDVEGLGYEEIAGALELPIGTVRSRLHRARLDLKAKLERFLP